MCNTCVIHKWSRRVVTMLPWLVIPLIGLWAISQLLPPAFRFEITPARLACVFVLLVTLFWYEVLMPQLSAWRVRRNARLRERKRFEAIELQKLRKSAIRRCRNCLTPYRDQNPGCGRFMCSCCGHISKRPVLDLPVPPGLRISNSRIIKDLVGKGGKILNGKTWSDNGWMCGQDWLESGNWVGGSFAGKSSCWRNGGRGLFGVDEHCSAEKSYSSMFMFACKLLTCFLLSIRWLWRKIFRVSNSENSSEDAEHGGSAKRGENGGNFNESRGEKARRKAEEKRQARLEKELLEEEDRKQREEVARLVEERRRLRDERLEAENRTKGSLLVGERETKKELEKKPRKRRREKDKGSSKSNSDAEELEKKPAKESERKRDGDKYTEIDRRENQRSGTEIFKGQSMEVGHGTKNISSSSLSRGNAGSRYLDRMRGTFFSSSKAISSSGFFGKGANNVATIMKDNKPNSSVDHTHISAHRKDICQPERVAVPVSMNADHNIKCPVVTDPQPRPEPKKSWQQLFTRSSSVPPSSNANIISRPNAKFQAEVHSPQLCGQLSTTQSFDNPISFGLPSPFVLSPYPNGSTNTCLGFSRTVEPMFSRVGEGPHEYTPEEPELFEDPCYVPDPITLLGPVSESLDNFQLDLGTSFVRDRGLELPHALKNVSAFSEASRPSPIESPLSRLRDERHCTSNQCPSSPRGQDSHALPVEDVDANNKGTWQMWNTSPLGHDGLGLVGGSASWILPPERNRSNSEDFVHPSSQKTRASLFTQEDQMLLGTHSPQKVFYSSAQNGGTFSPVSSSDHDLWFQRQSTLFLPLSGSENHFSLKPQEETTLNERIYGSPNSSAINHPFEPSPANCWSKKDWAVHSSAEGIGKSPLARPHIGGLFPTPDVQSLWSFD